MIRSIAYGGYYAKPNPNAKPEQHQTPPTRPRLSVDALCYLHELTELEMKTVTNYLNELITEDELRGASRL